MEYRADLFLGLLAGLPPDERTDILDSIDRATDVKRRQIQRAAASEARRLERRRALHSAAMTRAEPEDGGWSR